MIQKLNDMQQEAVLHTEGPLLILAGAGSGKTRVLTNRIAYLIGEKRVNPRNILAITFTNKAADEMRERVDKIAGEGGIDVWVATFHSTCVRILRRYIDRIGFDNSFSIYDTDDSKTLIKNIFKSLSIDTQTLKEKNAMRVISQCKDKLIPPDEFKEDASDYREELTADVYVEYQKQLRKNNALDFDDLIVKTVELFEKCPEVLEIYQERFRYIMVDEYQDTNFAQFRLVELLADKYHNICVVGDDDQSIYKFRGADIENILSFEKSFRGAKVIKLEQNYRSTGNILNAANAVISHNRGRKDKTLWTSREGGNKVRLFQYDNAIDEADAVIRDIRANADESETGSKLSDFAVLYRTNAQSRLLEERCVTMGVPYQLIGGVNFYQRKEIKDVLAYLKTINNGRDDLAAKRIINVPKRGIGATSIGKIDALANAEGISFFDACRKFGNAKVDKFVELIDEYRAKLSQSKTAETGGTAAGIAEDASEAAGTSTFDISGLIGSKLNDTGYKEELEQEGEIEAQARIENIEELKSKAAEYDNLLEFLEEVALVAEVDGFDENASKLTLMTLHGAKGLEFPQVYITGMEEGLFPSMMSINSDDRGELEEERRICYVGITRAMNRLTLTFARSRMVNGETRWSKASRFVEEIPDAYLEKHVLDIAYLNRERTNDYEFESRAERRPVRAFDDDDFGAFRRPFNAAKSVMASKPAQMQKAKEIRKADKLEYGVGDRVQHIKFGIGTVKEIINGERDYEVKVEFDDFGMKNMLAGFAKLQKI